MKEVTITIPSEDLVKRFKEAAHDTWEAIAGDVFDAMAECEDSRTSIPASEVEELVADADHMVTHGHLTKEEIAVWQQLTYKQRHAILKSAFSAYKHWGF